MTEKRYLMFEGSEIIYKGMYLVGFILMMIYSLRHLFMGLSLWQICSLIMIAAGITAILLLRRADIKNAVKPVRKNS